MQLTLERTMISPDNDLLGSALIVGHCLTRDLSIDEKTREVRSEGVRSNCNTIAVYYI